MGSDNPISLSTTLAEILQKFCVYQVEFESWVVLTGQLCLKTDSGPAVTFYVDEKLSKQEDGDCIFNSKRSFKTAAVADDKESVDFYTAAESHGIADAEEENQQDIVTFNIPENEKSYKTADNLTFLRDTDTVPDDVKVGRVGERGDDNSSPRPVKVTFPNTRRKEAILKNVRITDSVKNKPFEENVKTNLIDIDAILEDWEDNGDVDQDMEPDVANISKLKDNQSWTEQSVELSQRNTNKLHIGKGNQNLYLDGNGTEIADRDKLSSNVEKRLTNVAGISQSSAIYVIKTYDEALSRTKNKYMRSLLPTSITSNEDSTNEKSNLKVRNMPITTEPSSQSYSWMMYGSDSDSGKKEKYICSICGKRVRHLKSHQQRMHADGSKYRCDLCNKSYTYFRALALHMEVHKGEKPYTCKTCGKQFVLPCNLSTHMRLHTGRVKRHRCKICQKRFADKSTLKWHIVTHTDQRAFTCQICGFAFHRPHHLKAHLQCHSGKKPFSCEICKRSFLQAFHLKRHLRIHTGEKPYTCDVCGKSFTQSGQLKRHSCRNKFNIKTV